jgi:hypothetical protein
MPASKVAELLKGIPRRLFRRKDARTRWLKALRHSVSPGEGRWWIDPTHTPLEATRFILVLYLFQAKIVDLSIDEPAWGFVRDFANLNRQRPFDDAVLWEAVAAMVKRFSLPQHWKGLGAYLGRILRQIRAKEWNRERKRGPTPLEDLRLSRRTAYRLMSQGVLPRIQLRQLSHLKEGATPAEIHAFVRAAEDRKARGSLREEAKSLLGDDRSSEAARKLLYRRLKAGESLAAIVGRLRRGSP